MIKKASGQPLISRLRVIHLYEADYNLLLKLLWSRRLTLFFFRQWAGGERPQELLFTAQKNCIKTSVIINQHSSTALNINWLKLLVGRQKQFFQDNRDITYVKQNWLLNLNEYMNTCQITCKSQHFWLPKVKRKYDDVKVEAAYRYANITFELKRINSSKIYFKALTLSDVCNATKVSVNYSGPTRVNQIKSCLADDDITNRRLQLTGILC